MDVRILSVSDRIADLCSRGFTVVFNKQSQGLIRCCSQGADFSISCSSNSIHEALLNVHETILEREAVSRETMIFPSEQYLDEGDQV